MSVKINKALTPEEQAIVGNIKSLLTQLEGAVGEQLPIEMADVPSAEQTVKGPGAGMPDIAKGVVKCDDPNAIPGGGGQTINKDETGRASAEEKMDELPVDDEEALGVLKSLLGIGKSRTVAKSRSLSDIRKSARRVDPVQAETLKVLKSLTDKVTAQQEVLHELLGGAETADQILGTRRVQKSAPRIPVQPSANDIMKVLSDAIAVQKSAESQPVEAGSMKDVLTGLWS